MKIRFPLLRSIQGQRQRGSAAVELAFILPMLIIFMTFPVFYARCFWHYTVAQKAAQDATRYLSQVPRSEMMSKKLAGDAATMAIRIAELEMEELAPGSTIDKPIAICGTVPCGSTAGKLPPTVRMFITFSMFDTFFGVVDTGRYGLTITADARMPYVGN